MAKKALKYVLCIYYLVQFQENLNQIKALFNSGSKINTVSPAYVKKLSLKIRKINVGAQKIDGSALEIFKMVIANFLVKNKVCRPRSFQKNFLVADTKFEIILKIFLEN